MKKKVKKPFMMIVVAFLLIVASVPVHAGLIRDGIWLGDVDEDGEVTLKDAAITLRYALNLSPKQLDMYEVFIADSDGNEKVELNDAKETLKMALNLKEKDKIGGGSDIKDKNCQIDAGKTESKAKFLYFEDEPMEANMLEGYSDYIKSQLVGFTPGSMWYPSTVPVWPPLPEEEPKRNAVTVGMMPVHTNQMEDVDYDFLIKNSGEVLFYVEEKNPLGDKKGYCLSAMQQWVVPTTMDVRIIGCYIRQK